MHVDDRVKRSVEMYDRAGELIPGWTQLISRRANIFASVAANVRAYSALLQPVVPKFIERLWSTMRWHRRFVSSSNRLM